MPTMLCLETFSEVLFRLEIWFSWLPVFPDDSDDCLFDLMGRFSLLLMLFSSWPRCCWRTLLVTCYFEYVLTCPFCYDG